MTFDIEPVRVEQSTNYDRLVLDIETDGTISPREALASAGDTLRNLVSLVADLEEAPQGLELGDTNTMSSGSPDLDLRIEELDLSERPRNCLKRAQINTIGELVERTMDDLLAITNFGQKSADEVVQRLDERGLSLRTRTERSCQALRARSPARRTPAHQKAMIGNLVASLIAAESIVTTEAKAKALRPVAEKCVTDGVQGRRGQPAQRGRPHPGQGHGPQALRGAGPRYAERPGGYTRILEAGPAPGDNAPMARIEFV